MGTLPRLVVAGLLSGAALAVVLVGWRLVLIHRGAAAAAEPTEPEAIAPPGPPQADLRDRGLLLPVEGVAPATLTDTFEDPRAGGFRVHHALDIMAPRGTPVLAAADGRIVQLHEGGAGGITVYELDTTGRYGYYYAHLDRYAAGLAEGQAVRRGDRLGYVGTTGNAPPGTPHLHFAIYEVADPRHPWRGRPIDPYPLWR